MIIHGQEEARYHDDGPPVSLDCFYMCSPDLAADCTKDWCSCQCHQWVDQPVDPQGYAQPVHAEI